MQAEEKNHALQVDKQFQYAYRYQKPEKIKISIQKTTANKNIQHERDNLETCKSTGCLNNT